MFMYAHVCLRVPQVLWEDTRKLLHPSVGDRQAAGWAGGSGSQDS